MALTLQRLGPLSHGKTYILKLQINGNLYEALGVITCERGDYFLCQNHFSGDSCRERHGFLHSWKVELQGREVLLDSGVVEVAILSNYFTKQWKSI